MAASYICTPTVIPLCLPSYYKGRPCVTSSTLIEISCDTPGALIFYTVNGRPPEPLEAWQMHDVTWPYDGPFTLNCSGTVGGSVLQTVRALATDAAVVKRSAIVTKIFHVLPVERAEERDDGSEGREPSRKKRTNRSTSRKAATLRSQPQIFSPASPFRKREVPTQTELKILKEANSPRPVTPVSGTSKWQRLSSLSRSRQKLVDHVFRSSQKPPPSTPIVPTKQSPDFVTIDVVHDTSPVAWEQSLDVDDRMLPTNDVAPRSNLKTERRVDFQTIAETEVVDNLERLVDGDDDRTYELDVSSDSDPADFRDADFDVSEELPDHLINNDQLRNEALVDSHLERSSGSNHTRGRERSPVDIYSAADTSDTRRKRVGNVRFADDTDSPTDKQSPVNGEAHSFSEMVHQSNQQISMVSRECQTTLESADVVHAPRIACIDCEVQCQMDSDDARLEKVAVNEMPGTEYVDQACQTPAVEYTILVSVATQTEEIDDPALTTVLQSVEMVSIAVGHSVTSESKSSQTPATTGQHLLDKAMQTEARFAAVFDDAVGQLRRRPREGVRVSPGRGYWRQQIDHLTKELKTQADNSLEFRSMISEPRMTGIKRVVVHEGLDEMVLVVNVGLQYHPEWCCKS